MGPPQEHPARREGMMTGFWIMVGLVFLAGCLWTVGTRLADATVGKKR